MPKNSCCDMPRGKQFGFLFTEGVSNKEQLAKTIAHELGHGYFQLKHPFEMGLKQGDLKDNLMDYAGGISLNKYQWDIMHDPGIVTGLFESDTSAWEVVKKQAGTIKGFIDSLNTTGTKLELKKGISAHEALLALGNTEWTWKHFRLEPTNTQKINTYRDKYIYTTKGGWIDMAHFMFYAGRAYNYKLQKESAQKTIEKLKDAGGYALQAITAQLIQQSTMDPVGEAVQDGYLQEKTDAVVAKHSAYSYEDLPSDKYGAEFGANYFDQNSTLTFAEQLAQYFKNLGATDPKNAPNYKSLPETDIPNQKEPSRKNYTTTPVYIQENP